MDFDAGPVYGHDSDFPLCLYDLKCCVSWIFKNVCLLVHSHHNTSRYDSVLRLIKKNVQEILSNGAHFYNEYTITSACLPSCTAK